MTTPPGSLLCDRYQLASRIAMGGMGEVWRATDLALGRAVAVKLLRSGCDGPQEDHARFRAEAQHAGSLSHPGIAQVYDYREADPPRPPFLVMELVEGPSLARLLDEGPVGPARAMGIVAQAAAALQAAHSAGLVHRDIKPGNLLISQNGDVKITDFGIAHAAGAASVTGAGLLIGTPAYMAPERAAGARATPAADLYALGIVAYQCLTGRVPFEGEPLAVALAHLEQPMPPLPPRVPADVAGLVADLTAKNPRARPGSAGEVAGRAERLRDALAGTAAGTAADAGPAGVAGVPAPTRRNRRAQAGFHAVMLLAVITAVSAAGWFTAGWHGPGPVPPSATARPGPAASHRTHRTTPPRRTGGATAVDDSGQAGPGAPVSHPRQGRGRHGHGHGHGSPHQAGTPAPTASPTPTGTPTPTATTPSGTPTPSATAPSGTPTPSATAPSGTSSPTGTPAQTGTPTDAPIAAASRSQRAA